MKTPHLRWRQRLFFMRKWFQGFKKQPPRHVLHGLIESLLINPLRVILVLALSFFCVTAWVLGTETGTSYIFNLAVSLFNNSQQGQDSRIKISGIQGSFLSGWQFDELAWSKVISNQDNKQIQLQPVIQIAQLQAKPLWKLWLGGTLAFQQLNLRNLKLTPIVSDKALTLPSSLTLPFNIRIDQLKIQSLEFSNLPGLALKNLKTTLSSNQQQHHIQIQGVAIQSANSRLDFKGDLKLATSAPFAIAMKAQGQGAVQLPGQYTSGLAKAFLDISGTLPQLKIKLNIEGQPVGLAALSESDIKSKSQVAAAAQQALKLNLDAEIQPFYLPFVNKLKLKIEGFNPRAWLADAPFALLSGQVDLQPLSIKPTLTSSDHSVFSTSVTGFFSIRNSQASSIDKGGLPFERAEAKVQLLPVKEKLSTLPLSKLSPQVLKYSLTLKDIYLQLGQLSKVQGNLVFKDINALNPMSLQGDLNFSALNLQQIVSHLPLTQLQGKAHLDGNGRQQSASIAMNDQVPNGLSIEAQADLNQQLLSLEKFTMRRARASIDVKAKVSFKGSQAFEGGVIVEHFSPQAWSAYLPSDINQQLQKLSLPSMDLSASLDLQGQLADDPSLKLKFRTQPNSVWYRQPIQITLGGEFSKKRIKDLSFNAIASQNQINITGSIGVVGDALTLDIKAPNIVQLWPGLYPSYPKILSCERSCGRIAALQSLDGVNDPSTFCALHCIPQSSLANPVPSGTKGIYVNHVPPLVVSSTLRTHHVLPEPRTVGTKNLAWLPNLDLGLELQALFGRQQLSTAQPLVIRFRSKDLYPSYPKIPACERSCGRIAALQSLDGVNDPSTFCALHCIPESSIANPVPSGTKGIDQPWRIDIEQGSFYWDLLARQFDDFQTVGSGQVQALVTLKQTHLQANAWSSSGELTRLSLNFPTRLLDPLTMPSTEAQKQGDIIAPLASSQGPADLATQDTVVQGVWSAQVQQGTLKINAELSAQRLGYIKTQLQAGLLPETLFTIDEKQLLTLSTQFRLSGLQSLSGVASLAAQTPIQLSGQLVGDLQLKHQANNWQSNGSLAGDNLQLAIVSQGIRFQDGQLRIALENDLLILKQLSFPAGLTGNAQWSLSQKNGHASLSAQRFPLIQRADRSLWVSGNLDLSAHENSWHIAGPLKIDKAIIDIPKQDLPTLSKDIIVRRKAVVTHAVLPATERKAAQPLPLTVDIGLDFGDAFQVKGRGLDTRVAGQIKVYGDGASLRASGVLNSRNGVVEGYGQKLVITRGRLIFQGPIENPALDVVALRTGLAVEAGINVTGNAQNPRVKLVSEPEVPDVEKLSWLVLGRAPEEASGLDSGLLLTAAGALLGSSHSVPLSKALGFDEFGLRRGTVGSSRGLLPSSSVAADSLSNSSYGSVASEVLTVGKRLSDTLYLSYEQALAGQERVVKFTYQISRRLSLIARAGSLNGLDILYTFSFD